MGQYHYTVNLDKREFLYPHKLGDGLKLLEQANSVGGVMVALHILLACSNGRGGGDFASHPLVGRWAGDRIAVIGDYADADDLRDDNSEFIYSLLHREEFEDTWETGVPPEWEKVFYKDISDDILPLVEDACRVTITGDGWRDKRKLDEFETSAQRYDMIITRQ